MEKVPLTVSGCLALINQTLEFAYPAVLVEGEVNSFKVNRDKYVFFDLKDDQSSLGCFMTVWQLRMPLEDGMRVQVIASPKLTAWGKFSLTVREIRPIGAGSIKKSADILQAKLEKEGLFNPERKRPLPPLPSSIGLIASAESAGYIDFLTIIGARWGGIDITVANVQVQGMGAAEQIKRAIEHFNSSSSPPEILVIVRGGGSADDLSTFNDEPLVRAVAASAIPILAGVGHEIDVSLVDMAADVRAATPSNAAEILTPDRRELISLINSTVGRIQERTIARLRDARQLTEQFAPKAIKHLIRQLSRSQQLISQQRRLLEQLSPKSALRRGYALIKHDGKLVGRDQQKKLTVGNRLQIELEYIMIKAGVEYVQKNN